MPNQDLPENAPATALFPQFEAELYRMFEVELEGLTDAQLDFVSDRWEWSDWSIRRNFSHTASGDFRWLWGRWSEQLFPNGHPSGDEFNSFLEPAGIRWFDEARYPDLGQVFENFQRGLGLCWTILSNETVGSLRRKEIYGDNMGFMTDYGDLFPGGLRLDPNDDSAVYMTLEATFLHRYYEHTTHLYNIQRLKRAQGLPTRIEIPFEGYWATPNWDRSEP